MRHTVAALLACGVVACGGSKSEEPTAATGPIAVTTAPVRVATLRDSITAPGTVTPIAAAEFTVVAPEPAEIVELTKNEGDIVNEGDVLVRFDIPAVATEVATRQIELSDATMKVERAKAEADRLGKLFEQGLTSANSFAAARSALSTAESHFGEVKARFDQAKALEASTSIRARFTGVVVKRFHVKGDLVTGGTTDPIMRVIDPTRLQVSAQVPLTSIIRVIPGQIASVQTGVEAVPAVVALRLPPATPTEQTGEVRLNFVAPTTLPPDSLVQIEIIVEERKDVMTVPSDALQRAEGLVFVWVPNDNGQAVRKQVQPGLVAGNLTQIVSGLTAGEPVIVTGIPQLTEGAQIVVR